MPTYNCLELTKAGLPHVRLWQDLADEIIVVDSFSTDGTAEYLAEHLRHPGLRVIRLPRGLYESWNEGIAATKGRHVYISTAGDTITREQLLHLLASLEEGGADAIVSRPVFISDSPEHRWIEGWRTARLLAAMPPDSVRMLSKEESCAYSFLDCPGSLLGSLASDLFRGDFLRARPFPTEYGRFGDTAWIMRHCADSRLAITSRVGSTFLHHSSEAPLSPEGHFRFYRRLMLGERHSLRGAKELGALRRLLRTYVILKLRCRLLWLAKKRLRAERPGLNGLVRAAGTAAAYLAVRIAQRMTEARIRWRLR
jgi:glycosyltransferase involved in cell wall biosynthesis